MRDVRGFAHIVCLTGREWRARVAAVVLTDGSAKRFKVTNERRNANDAVSSDVFG